MARRGHGPVRSVLFDAVLAVGLALVGTSLVRATVAPPDRFLATALTLAHTLPLVVRRRHPTGVLVWMVSTGLLYATRYDVVGLGPGVLVAVFTVAARGPARRSLAHRASRRSWRCCSGSSPWPASTSTGPTRRRS